MDMMDASDFWDVMDTNELTREEIVLVTSYLVAYWRKHGSGSKIMADTFVSQAKIEEVKELKYHDVYMKCSNRMDYWTFYFHEKLMLERLKVDPLKLEMEGLKLETSQGTQTNLNPHPLNVDQDVAVLPFPKISTLCKLSEYTLEYTMRNFIICHVAEAFVQNGDNPMLDPERVKRVIETAEIWTRKNRSEVKF
ncbi:uncharacterized protein LOC111914594 [Lactuca sativa]|uniref:uncharacterized protein LOC111914594 n=1 Tax=Lactuca sativa TaxID=4236 RepID=UPI001C689064|nr:uncharacterized protein LOC111914594 [Lactuca sativa]